MRFAEHQVQVVDAVLTNLAGVRRFGKKSHSMGLALRRGKLTDIFGRGMRDRSG